MFRNEMTIASAWAEQASCLFDFALLGNHRTTDETEEILTRIPNSRFVDINADGYPQAEAMTSLMAEAFRLGAEWVIPLDLDEFFPFNDYPEFSAYLDRSSRMDFLLHSWRNLSAEPFPEDFSISHRFTYRHSRARFSKVCVNRSAFVRNPRMKLSQGCHRVDDPFFLNSPSKDVHLLHIPVRSAKDWASKIRKGYVVHEEEPSMKQLGLGTHWLGQEKLSTQGYSWKSWCYPADRCSRIHLPARTEKFDFVYTPRNAPRQQVSFPGTRATLELRNGVADMIWTTQ